MKLTKSDILNVQHVRALEFDAVRNIVATGVSTDSRTTKRGDLFLALRGETFDGHNFISNATQSGAAALVVERRWADANQEMMARVHVPTLVVEEALLALGGLARIHRRKFNIPVLAVGGSNGKTTTKEMIRSVLAQKFSVLATDGNLNNQIGVPQTIFRLEKKHQIAVVEIGTNHPGEIAYLCGVLEPTHGLITNIGREHLEFFGSVEGVANAECELFDYLRGANGFAFVNADDTLLKKKARLLKKKTTFGFKARTADVRGTVKRWTDDAHAIVAVKGRRGKALSAEVGAPGAHNAANAVAAAAIGLQFGVPPEKTRNGLESFRAVGKRTQTVSTRGITILNDAYNSNPDSALAGLATLRALKNRGKKIAALGDMLELGTQGEEQHRAIGRALTTFGVQYLLTHGPLSKFTYEAASVKFKFHYEQKNLLAEYLLELLAAGDAVLVKGSRGTHMEDVVTFLTERLKKAA